jgi:hypothetical protein
MGKRVDTSLIDWKTIQDAHDNGLNFSEIVFEFSVSAFILRRAVREGLFRRNASIVHLTDERRKLLSDRMKSMRKSGIGNLTHRKSIPCEHLKAILRKKGLEFEEEFMPLKTRLFRVDIAFPSLKLGIEVNGNQHYEAGNLKKYYQERHDLITSSGWKLIEMHYSLCYSTEYIDGLIIQWKDASVLTRS